MSIDNKIEVGAFGVAIQKTLIFFDIFELAPSALEIWRHLGMRADLGDVIQSLDEQNQSGDLGFCDGFYFLKNRHDLARKRTEKYIATERKLQKARRAARLFGLLPWVRAVAIGNLIGGRNMRDGGDIDLFIITSAKRAWVARFFCALTAQILGWRPRPGSEKDKICLSFFVDEDNLSLSGLALNGIENDLYLIYWTAGLHFILNKGDVMNDFFEANQWINKELPNFNNQSDVRAECGARKTNNDLFNKFGDYINQKLFVWQYGRLPAEIKNLANKDACVVVNSGVLKFHTKDNRAAFNTEFGRICREKGLNV